MMLNNQMIADIHVDCFPERGLDVSLLLIKDRSPIFEEDTYYNKPHEHQAMQVLA
jgi:hypothetical protein